MIRAKFIIITALLICIISIGSAVIESMAEPDSNGKNLDSYGTEFYGMRGLYDTAKKLNLPIDRNVTPPDTIPTRADTILFCSPSPSLMLIEPQYMRNLLKWVHKGGRIIIAPNRHSSENRLNAKSKETFDHLIGLKGIKTSLITPIAAEPEPPKDKAKNKKSGGKKIKVNSKAFRNKIEKNSLQKAEYEAITLLNIIHNKKAPEQLSEVESIALPENFRYISSFGKNKPKYKIMVLDKQNKERAFAAVFKKGKGEIVFIADPSLFFNRFYFSGDNAVLSILLLYPVLKPVIIDEFYHGLNIKGKPFWLLTKMPYTLIILLMVVTVCLWALRSATRLGPAVKICVPNRRTLHEYISAMSRLFSRADARKYILNEAYEGILWHIRRELSLSPKKQNAKDLFRILSHKNPERAARLLNISEKIELLLSRSSINKADALNLIREMNECL